MKLVDLLARELESWPDGLVAYQDHDKEVRFMGGVTSYDFYAKELAEEDTDTSAPDGIPYSGPVTQEQWQSARDKLKGETKVTKPKGNKDGWVRHRGWKCPVEKGAMVSVRLRDGTIRPQVYATGGPSEGYWKHRNSREDIMAYRIRTPEQAEPSIVEHTGELPSMKASDLESAGQPVSYLMINDFPLQSAFDGPLQWRDRIKEIDATVVALEDERSALIQRLADEGLALLRVDGKPMPSEPIKAEDSAQGEDMSDPAKWKVGDIITFTGVSDECFTNGCQYELLAYEAKAINAVTVKEDDEGDENGWREYYFKWHSRPSKP